MLIYNSIEPLGIKVEEGLLYFLPSDICLEMLLQLELPMNTRQSSWNSAFARLNESVEFIDEPGEALHCRFDGRRRFHVDAGLAQQVQRRL